MASTPMALSEYLGDEIVLMWVEHDRCGRSLGTHQVCVATGIGGDGHVDIQKSPGPHRGPLTTPRVVTGYHSGRPGNYARIWCGCLAGGHVEKIRTSKLDALLVTFPEWKWGRRINLPVVTI
jgi:hypothetical protein